jgi:hypothetical protein
MEKVKEIAKKTTKKADKEQAVSMYQGWAVQFKQVEQQLLAVKGL